MPRWAAAADEHRGEVLAVGVDGAGHEGALGAQRERDRVERVVQRAHRGGLGDLAELAGGGVLALGEPVDPVVEQQDRHVHVAAQRVDQVVAADRERVAVTGDHPDRQVRARRREAGGDRRRAAVDRVHAVGVEVVGEPRRAADAGDEDDVLALEPEVGQEALDRGEHGVVAAAGAPADLLVGGELLAVLRLVGGGHAAQAGERQRSVVIGRSPSVASRCGRVPAGVPCHGESGVHRGGWCSTRSVMASASSAARSGRPRTWL